MSAIVLAVAGQELESATVPAADDQAMESRIAREAADPATE